MRDHAPCWYVAYGSNIELTKLARWLARPVEDLKDRWLQVPRTVYFGGESRTWGGPVAFLSLQERAEASSYCRAVLTSEEGLAAIFRRENGVGELPRPIADLRMSPGEWRHVLVARLNPWQGKYNALLRLEDIDGVPAYTLTTDRPLAVGRPTQAYLDVITAAIREHVGHESGDEYRARLDVDLGSDNRAYLVPLTRAVWTGVVGPGGSTGFSVVRLPASSAPITGPSLYLGRLGSGGKTLSTWVSFSAEEGAQALASSSVARALGWQTGAFHSVRLELEPLLNLERRPGQLSDIPASDVVQVSPDDAAALGRWAVAATPHFSGAVRVQGRADVRAGDMRLAYAACTLLAAGKDDVVVLQALSADEDRLSPIRRAARATLEWLLGAPPLALRATEGLVGDDGRKVARVDATALEYIGVSAGGVAILSWAHKSTTVRLLAQTAETRECMDAQLAETTGRQTRTSITDIGSRSQTPHHLRVWVSSSARNALGVPPDTVVRVRRSLPDLCLRQASAAAVPTVGLIIAALAVPGVNPWVWVLAAVLTLILVALPLRRSERPAAVKPPN